MKRLHWPGGIIGVLGPYAAFMNNWLTPVYAAIAKYAGWGIAGYAVY